MTPEAHPHSDKTHAPETQHKGAIDMSGAISKLLYNAHGDCDGLIVDGNQQIHFAPRLSAQVLKHLKAGDKIHIQGHKLVAVGLVIANSITPPGGTSIVDNGPPAKPDKH